MGAMISLLLGKIVASLTWIGVLVTAVFAALWLLSTDLGAWVFEQVMDVAIAALDSVDFQSQLFNPATYITSLPPEVGNMLGMLQLGQCFAIIASACVLKITLQLIPFTRLGS